MKKIVSALFLTVFLLLQSVSTGAVGVSWYCKREKDHKTPAMPSEFNYIRELGGYSHDERHTSYEEGEKVIYLTFDAGYENGNVAKILDILKEKDVKGAFFVLGHLIEKDTDLVIRMSNEGHLVCNHTYSHKNMSVCSQNEFEEELIHLEKTYEEKIGKRLSKFYRPPEGRFTKENLMIAQSMGYKTVFWSFAYADWDNQKQPEIESALKKVTENLHNGEIMLLHPTSATNVSILARFIDYAKEEGFRFATLDELE